MKNLIFLENLINDEIEREMYCDMAKFITFILNEFQYGLFQGEIASYDIPAGVNCPVLPDPYTESLFNQEFKKIKNLSKERWRKFQKIPWIVNGWPYYQNTYRNKLYRYFITNKSITGPIYGERTLMNLNGGSFSTFQNGNPILKIQNGNSFIMTENDYANPMIYMNQKPNWRDFENCVLSIIQQYLQCTELTNLVKKLFDLYTHSENNELKIYRPAVAKIQNLYKYIQAWKEFKKMLSQYSNIKKNEILKVSSIYEIRKKDFDIAVAIPYNMKINEKDVHIVYLKRNENPSNENEYETIKNLDYENKSILEIIDKRLNDSNAPDLFIYAALFKIDLIKKI